MTPRYNSLLPIQEDLRKGKITCLELVEYYLSQIEKNKALNAYIEVYEQEAKEKARAIDRSLREAPSSLGRLFGMVLSIKDLLCYKDHPVTGGSKILSGFVSQFSATAIARLIAEDAIIIGRVNCDEFGMGSANEYSHYGAVRNAIDPAKVSGGSSGGSAVAVQTDTCLASIGSDTGGSIRQPAAFCGLVGMKPSYGRISRHGLLAYASSFDQIGSISRSVEDAAILLEVMAGADDYDATCSDRAIEKYSENLEGAKNYRIAYFKNALHHEKLDKEISEASLQFLNRLAQMGHSIEAIDFEYLDYLVPIYYVLTTAEASSNLSRYDGVRYGYRSPEQASSLKEHYQKTRTEAFGTEVKRRIMLGTFVLSSGYYDAYFAKAQKGRRLIKDFMDKLFEDYDFLVMPTCPETAWALGAREADPIKNYLADVYTVLANLAGLPAISLPLGVDKGAMPFGIQLIAAPFAEQKLLHFSYQCMS
ncbi:MAG TPA: Asp-tRNA(Asn)/Glu-tRNA(Gln) amidotransferase subunit GatA [Phaeodactylibacter sp.]|nr:Asp-tRNA(Asn)/Glu-tRNA(Gln) amidotransferase subunit GatA [Phaeodactylibacter sp.]